MIKRKRRIVYFSAMAAFAVLMAVLTVFVGLPMVRLAQQPEAFRAWVDSFGIWGRLVFLGIVVFQVIVAFVPGEPIELAAGYVFGFWEGTFLTMAGFLTGSWIVFCLVRRFGSSAVEVFFSGDRIERMSFLKNPKKTRALALILMTIPGTPKDFLSYFAGLTNLKLGNWLAIVAVSRIPSLVTSTLTGAAAGEERYILSAVTFVISLIISGCGILYYRHICNLERKLQQKNPTA